MEHRAIRFFKKNENALLFLVLLGWFIYICLTSAQHVLWRDEMRALSIAKAGPFWELPKLLKNEGHPILWYFLLNISYGIFKNTVVLKVISVLVALASVALFFFYSPFKFWQKILFAFSFFPLVEYAIPTRNYGISMLLLFGFAALYSKRKEHLIGLSVILALLANTNLHCCVLTMFLIFIWVWEDVVLKCKKFYFKENYTLILALLIVIMGVAFSLYTFYPDGDSRVSSANLPELSALGYLLLESLLSLGDRFSAIFPLVPKWSHYLLTWIFVAGFLVRPLYAIVFLAAALFFQLFFTIYYPGFARHQGLLFMFWIALCWIITDKEFLNKHRKDNKFFKLGRRRLFYFTFIFIFPLVLALQVNQGVHSSITEHTMVSSSSKDFGEFLANNTRYKDAILIGEPDYNLESMPYYVDNRIYIPREGVFKDYVSFTKKSKISISLSELLMTGLMLRETEHKPVLIVLGHLNLKNNAQQLIHFGYGSQFTWSRIQLEEFDRSTKKIASFYRGWSSEKYDVFEVL